MEETQTEAKLKKLPEEASIHESYNDNNHVLKSILDDQEDALTSKVRNQNKDPSNRHASLNNMFSNLKLEDDYIQNHPPVNFKPEDPQRTRRITKMLQKYDRPIPAFKQTESYKQILKKVQQPDAESEVVHIYGFSGNGKSQILRAVCRKMDEENSEIIIWHIKCTKGSDTVKSECLKLVDKLMNSDLVTEKLADGVRKDMTEGDTHHFVQMLMELDVLVLFAVEDVTKEEQQLFAKFVQDVHDAKKHKTSIPNTGLKVLIATCGKLAVYPDDQLNAMDRYCLVKIEGFDPKEAEEFLTGVTDETIIEKTALTKLAKILAYSPLRLTLCKRYCEKYKVSYESYLGQLGKSKSIIEREKKLIQDHPSLANHHGYEVIMKLLKPDDPVEPESPFFLVMELLSFMANEYIPKLLLRKLYHHCHKTMSWHMTKERMEDMVVALKDDNVFQERDNLLSTHADILYAINLSILEKERGKKLYEILQALIEIISKDNHITTINDLLYNMQKHIEIVIEHARNYLDATFNVESPRNTDFCIQMNLSRLYDVLGFARSHNCTKGSADECFGKALDMMLAVISSYDGKSSCCAPIKNSVQSAMLNYSPNKEPSNVVKELYKQIQNACKRIPVEFIENFSLCFRKGYLEDMQKYLKDKNVDIEWKLMEKELHANGQLSSKSVEVLRRKNVRMLLTTEQLRKCFLLEIIVSILHSRGRQVLYLKGSISLDEQKRYEWYSEVGYLLSKEFSQNNGIKIMNEYIAVANFLLPRKLQNRNGELDDVFLDRILSARDSAKEVIRPEGLFYERGVFRLVAGTAYTEINALKYVVKANTKLMKRPGVYSPSEEEERKEVEDCEKLYKLAKENTNFTISGNCCVQVGKYYAAKKKFKKAIEAFESAFSYEEEEHGIDKDLEMKPNTFAWAVYNYARVMTEAGPGLQDWDDLKLRFTERYNRVIVQDVIDDWKVKLLEMKKNLDSITP